MAKRENIGIIGSGLIGRSWAMLFASSGAYNIYLYDVNPKQVSNALSDIKIEFEALQSNGMLRGNIGAADQLARIQGTSSLSECVKDCKYIQECVPENLQLKRKVFEELDDLVEKDTIMASSTSCILPSKLSENLRHKQNLVVVHPVNPPYHVKFVEIVPSEWTTKAVVEKTRSLMEEIGQSPVTLSREIPGFALNRLQYVILNECVHLVNEGILSVEDVDTTMKEGLAPRYAWMGPLETAHLNAEGMGNYLERYGKTIHTVTHAMKPPPQWSKDEFRGIIDQLDRMVPLDQLQIRRAWRDERLIALARLKMQLKKQD